MLPSPVKKRIPNKANFIWKCSIFSKMLHIVARKLTVNKDVQFHGGWVSMTVLHGLPAVVPLLCSHLTFASVTAVTCNTFNNSLYSFSKSKCLPKPFAVRRVKTGGFGSSQLDWFYKRASSMFYLKVILNISWFFDVFYFMVNLNM